MHGLCISFDFRGEFFDDINEIVYDGRLFTVENGKPNESHQIWTTYGKQSELKESFRSACRFLDELAWFRSLKISSSNCVHSNGSPRCSDRSELPIDETILLTPFDQLVTCDRSHLALSLYREGYVSNSPFYRFVSYFKIIELGIPDGNSRKLWMGNALKEDQEIERYLHRLNQAGIENVGAWLYKEGRNGLVHAGKAGINTKDPSDFDDWQDIVWANEIVLHLVERILIKNLQISKNERE
jgi:hypothetical protein